MSSSNNGSLQQQVATTAIMGGAIGYLAYKQLAPRMRQAEATSFIQNDHNSPSSCQTELAVVNFTQAQTAIAKRLLGSWHGGVSLKSVNTVIYRSDDGLMESQMRDTVLSAHRDLNYHRNKNGVEDAQVNVEGCRSTTPCLVETYNVLVSGNDTSIFTPAQEVALKNAGKEMIISTQLALTTDGKTVQFFRSKLKGVVRKLDEGEKINSLDEAFTPYASSLCKSALQIGGVMGPFSEWGSQVESEHNRGGAHRKWTPQLAADWKQARSQSCATSSSSSTTTPAGTPTQPGSPPTAVAHEDQKGRDTAAPAAVVDQQAAAGDEQPHSTAHQTAYEWEEGSIGEIQSSLLFDPRWYAYLQLGHFIMFGARAQQAQYEAGMTGFLISKLPVPRFITGLFISNAEADAAKQRLDSLSGRFENRISVDVATVQEAEFLSQQLKELRIKSTTLPIETISTSALRVTACYVSQGTVLNVAAGLFEQSRILLMLMAMKKNKKDDNDDSHTDGADNDAAEPRGSSCQTAVGPASVRVSLVLQLPETVTDQHSIAATTPTTSGEQAAAEGSVGGDAADKDDDDDDGAEGNEEDDQRFTSTIRSRRTQKAAPSFLMQEGSKTGICPVADYEAAVPTTMSDDQYFESKVLLSISAKKSGVAIAAVAEELQFTGAQYGATVVEIVGVEPVENPSLSGRRSANASPAKTTSTVNQSYANNGTFSSEDDFVHVDGGGGDTTTNNYAPSSSAGSTFGPSSSAGAGTITIVRKAKAFFQITLRVYDAGFQTTLDRYAELIEALERSSLVREDVTVTFSKLQHGFVVLGGSGGPRGGIHYADSAATEFPVTACLSSAMSPPRINPNKTEDNHYGDDDDDMDDTLDHTQEPTDVAAKKSHCRMAGVEGVQQPLPLNAPTMQPNRLSDAALDALQAASSDERSRETVVVSREAEFEAAAAAAAAAAIVEREEWEASRRRARMTQAENDFLSA